MSAALHLPVHYTLQEFLSWNPGDGRRYELVDGQPRAMAPTSNVHGFLQIELGSLLREHLRRHRTSCEVIGNPGVVPRLLASHNFRIPDLGVTCAPIVPGPNTLADPVLLIEILSPSNQADTWSNVWTYTTIPSVQEILVLHSSRIAAELLRRTPDGGWPSETDVIDTGDLVLTSIEFRMALAELYARSGLTA
jgi:Uma2 family endonuclease